MLLGCCLHSYIDFYFVFILRCKQADVFATDSSPVSLTPVNSLSPVLLTPEINTKVANISASFRKNSNWPIGILRGPGEIDS